MHCCRIELSYPVLFELCDEVKVRVFGERTDCHHSLFHLAKDL